MRSLSVKRGFTLIELLVVIAIIAILASILFPVFAKAREKARQTTCLSQIRQIAIAAQMYDQDNNARYPGIGGQSNWDQALGNYLGNNAAMFTCPSDSSSDSNVNSYGYSGMMVTASGAGVNESVITAPTEVGVDLRCLSVHVLWQRRAGGRRWAVPRGHHGRDPRSSP